MKTEKQQYPMLDLCKFLCALLILLYHYFSEHRVLPWILEEALSSYAIAVALFMVTSGFLTFNKLESVCARSDRWKIVAQQASKIIRIYLLWSVVYIAYTVGTWDAEEISASFVFLQLRQWIFNSTFYTIWFMPSLAIGMVVAFWMIEFLPRKAVILLCAALYTSGALLLTYKAVGSHIPSLPLVSEFVSTWLGGPRGWLFFGLPLVTVGYCMVRYRARKNNLKSVGVWAVLSILSVSLMLVEALTLRYFCGPTGIDMTMMMPISVFCILGFLLNFRIPEGGYLVWMRKMSVLIFVTQRIFLTILPDILPIAIVERVFTNKYVGRSMCVVGHFCFLQESLHFQKK